MGKTIHLDKDIFEKIKSGKKKFEIRLGNKDINEGDKLVIVQRDANGNLTNNKITKKATYVELTKNLPYWTKDEVNKFGFKIIQLE